MGLDIADLTMNIEDTFDIQFPERLVVPVKTAGDLHALIVAEMSKREVPDEDAVWNKLVELICKFGKMNPARVQRTSRLIEDLDFG